MVCGEKNNINLKFISIVIMTSNIECIQIVQKNIKIKCRRLSYIFVFIFNWHFSSFLSWVYCEILCLKSMDIRFYRNLHFLWRFNCCIFITLSWNEYLYYISKIFNLWIQYHSILPYQKKYKLEPKINIIFLIFLFLFHSIHKTHLSFKISHASVPKSFAQ